MITNKEKKCKEPLVDYFNSHMVTSYQYLVVLKHKALDKEVGDIIRELKTKEKKREHKEGLKTHLPKLSKQLKGKLRKMIKLSLMT